MMANAKKILYTIALISLVLDFSGVSNALDINSIQTSITETIGPDQIPYSVYRISKDNNTFVDLNHWIAENFSDDATKVLYYLPETLLKLKVKTRSAVAFKTWEYNNYVQNIVVNYKQFLVLYTTPHGSYNPDGLYVFKEVLGVTIPKTQFTTLSEDSHSSVTGNETDATPPCEDVPGILSASKASCGSKVGSYNNVNAYSNYSVNSKDCCSATVYCKNYSGSCCTGYKWQCVEYVDRYFKQRFGRCIGGGNANTYYSNASSKGLHRAANGGSNGPQTGNILCSAGGKYGHVAIVREVGSNYIKVVEQNWYNSSDDNSMKLNMTVKSGKYTVSGFSSSYSIQGWLWP
jgi:surface antigen